MSDDFAIEWADFMEEAWQVYADFFGTEFEERLELYAFRTYDDYRNYCMETGNQGNLKAGGFADPRNNRGVGWTSGNFPAETIRRPDGVKAIARTIWS